MSIQSSLGGSYASAETAPVSMPSTVMLPAPPSAGCLIDHYKNNSAANETENTNRVLFGYNQLWKPGATWDTGTKLNSSVLDANIQKVVDTAAQRTPSEADAAYLDGRRKQSYSVIDSLGPLTDIY